MSYKIAFLPSARKDFDEWKKAGDEKTVLKIKEILHDIAEHPYSGIGKPEPLRHNLSGKWSRRINKQYRMIYEIHDAEVYVTVISLRSHYGQK